MTEKEAIRLIRVYSDLPGTLRDINNEIQALKRDIEYMRQLTAVQCDGMPHGTGTSDPTARQAIEIADIYDRRIAELNGRVRMIMDNRRLVDQMLDTLSRDERRVITARYIDNIRWDYIPGRINISRTWCFKLEKRALKKICAKF